jgi:hypothetical protein
LESRNTTDRGHQWGGIEKVGFFLIFLKKLWEKLLPAPPLLLAHLQHHKNP